MSHVLRAVAVRAVRSAPGSTPAIEARSNGPYAILTVGAATAFERRNEIDVVLSLSKYSRHGAAADTGPAYGDELS